MIAKRDQMPAVIAPERITLRPIPGGHTLFPDQRTAVQTVLSSRDQVMALIGIAGAGKTTTIAQLRVNLERAGYDVIGVAPTSKSAQELAGSGIAKTMTLQKYLSTPLTGGPPRYIFLDESSMADTMMVKRFLDRLRPEDRALMVGDIAQHQSVGPGKSFQQLLDAGMRAAYLTTIVRQADPAQRSIVEHLAAGRVTPAIDKMNANGHIHVVPERANRMATVAGRVLANPAHYLAVCPDNQTRRDLNTAVHTGLQAQGKVGHDRAVRVLVPRALSGADRALAYRYERGDVVRFSRGGTVESGRPFSRPTTFVKGEYVTVLASDEATNRLTVRRSNGQHVTYRPERLHGVTVYRDSVRQFGVGDRIQTTSPLTKLGIVNRQLGTVKAISDTTVTIEFDPRQKVPAKTVTLPFDRYPHLDHGYAMTSYSVQSQTTKNVLYVVDSERASELIVNRRSTYVAVSRGSVSAEMYVDDPERLPWMLNRDVHNRAAVELVQPGKGRAMSVEQALGISA